MSTTISLETSLLHSIDLAFYRIERRVESKMGMEEKEKVCLIRYKQMRAWAKMHRKRYVNIKGNCVQDRKCFPGISR